MKHFELFSYLLIPIFILSIICHGIKKRISLYDEFLNGTVDGVKTAYKIFPTILAIIVSITIFRESGAMNLIMNFISPITSFLGIPNEILPLGFMSSISGGASLGLLADTLSNYGPDSQIGKMASAILGSSETTIYVLAIYTAAVKVKKTRGALWIGLLCDFVALCIAVWMCK